MKLAVEQAILDDNGNLKLLPGERLLAKKKLLCWIYRKWLLRYLGPYPSMIFSTDEGFIYRTNQRIVCTKILDESIVSYDVCVEVPLDEVIKCMRGLFGLTLVHKESKGDRYIIYLRPRKSAKEFLGEVLNYKSMRRIK